MTDEKRGRTPEQEQRRNEQQRIFRATTRDIFNGQQREYRATNKELAIASGEETADAAYTKLWKLKNKDTTAIQYIARTYAVDKEYATELYKRAKGNCDCCGRSLEETGQKNNLSVDHDHDTGEVRGVLCHACNASFGLLRESETRILALLDYWKTHKGK
jgi:hypothetical protein